MIDETILLHYPAPVYFFVNANNAALAQRLERGLRAAIEDGSFDRLFRNHPAHKELLARCAFDRRKIFKLDNPLLPAETPLDQMKLWLCP